MPFIREEKPDDWDGLRDVNRTAFGRNDEADLVDRLRAAGLVVASLVAIEDGQVAGHILFTRLEMETNRGPLAAASLAPLAVRPEFQRRGIGSALVRRGLDVCRERDCTVVIVVGHPDYYPRFGFSAALAVNLRSPFSGDAWMAAELVPRSLAGIVGTVHYPGAFGI
jgi:putative acetyltransferase